MMAEVVQSVLGDERLQHTNFVDVLTQDPNKRRMANKLCKLLNKLAPINLPQMFLDMDSYKIHKNYPNGKYWSKAALFVVGTTPISPMVWDQMLKEELQSDCVHANHPLLSKELCDRFKDDFEAPEKDCENLFHWSWVFKLIRIYPPVMFQWWLSSSCYLLQIETHLADFYHLKFPQYLQETVQRLVSLVEKVRFYLNLGLQCLLVTVKDEERVQIIYYVEIISVVSTILKHFKTENIALLDAIKCLKRMCWSESSERKVTISPADLHKSRDLQEEYLETPCKHEFVLPLWDSLPASVFMREQLVACTGCTSCKETIQTQKIKDFEDAKKMQPNASLETLKSFISKSLIKKGRFQVGDQEALLKHADDPEIWKFFYKCIRNRGFLGSETESGPFVNVLVLTVDLEQANLEAAITQRLSTLSGIKSLAVDCEGPDMTLDEIKRNVFNKIESVSSWTFNEALKVSKEQEVSKANFQMKRNEDSASYLQFKIKSVVLREVKEPYTSCESVLFIQYLLPCFVASYYDLREDRRVSLKARNFYLNFIKQLLKNLEDIMYKGSFFMEDSMCFIKWKFETVCMDLEGCLYNEIEDPNTEGGQPPFITSIMKSNCFDVFTDFLGKTDDQPSLRFWKYQLYMFSNSLQNSLCSLTQKPPGFSWKYGAGLRAMSTLCRILAAEVFKRQGFIADKTESSNTNLLLGAIFKCYAKSEKLMKIQMMPGYTKNDTWSNFQTKVETESSKLSEHQQVALALYMCLSSTGVKNMQVDETCDPELTSTIDAVERVYYQTFTGKHLRVQQTLSSWQRDEQGVNQAQVSYKYAMEVAPLCYSVVTCRLTKDMKIRMKEPGEITFCPVRHCRWCGQVETEQKELFVCQFCKDNPKYPFPDVNLFCSLDCEEKTLDMKHREEHYDIVGMQCGVRDVEPFMGVTPKKHEPNLIEDLEQFTEAELDVIVEGAIGANSSVNTDPQCAEASFSINSWLLLFLIYMYYVLMESFGK